MQSKLAALQEQINAIDEAIQQGAADAQLNLWEMQRKELNDQLQTALQEEAQQEVTAEKIGYILDNITVEGLTIAEIITNDGEYNLVRKGVQDAFTIQAQNYEEQLTNLRASSFFDLKSMTDRATQSEQANEQLKKDSNNLETVNFQLNLDNEALDEKVRKGAELLYDAVQQIEQQKTHIQDLQNQIALGVRGALNVVNMPQDTSKLAAEIIAKKVRVTNVQFKDKDGIDLRLKSAEIVLTGEKVEYEAIYEKRYIILDAEQAEQYRTDEANKRAELELQDTIIPTQPLKEDEVDPVSEVEAPAEKETFQESNQVPNTGHDLALESSEDNRESDEEKTLMPEPDRIGYIELEHKRLWQYIGEVAKRVENIEIQANIKAVA